MICSYLLRHNDIHYARACQVFSIELEKQMIWKSINFSLWFWTKRRQTTRLTGQWAATFDSHSIQWHLALQKNNNNRRKGKKFEWHKITIYILLKWHCCQERFISSSSSSQNIVMPHKSETKWIYWPLFSPDIDMISLKLCKLKNALMCSGSIINQSIGSIVRMKRG